MLFKTAIIEVPAPSILDDSPLLCSIDTLHMAMGDVLVSRISANAASPQSSTNYFLVLLVYPGKPTVGEIGPKVVVGPGGPRCRR